MVTSNDIMLAAFTAALAARIRAVGNRNSFSMMGEEAMSEALEATQGALILLKARGMVTTDADKADDECQHPEDTRTPMTTLGSLMRFYCGACHGFYEDADGGLRLYQEKEGTDG